MARAGLSEIFNAMLEAVFVMYKPSVLRALPAATNALVRGVVNGALASAARAAAQSACPAPRNISNHSQRFVDLQGSSVFSSLGKARPGATTYRDDYMCCPDRVQSPRFVPG